MFTRIRKLFTPIIVYKIVEVAKPRPTFRWDQNTKDAVSTLTAHPGFVALTDKLSLINSQLKTKCYSSVHKELREVDFLQAGIFWSNWLREQIEQATVRGSVKQYVDPMAEELEAFKLLDAQIERVGMD